MLSIVCGGFKHCLFVVLSIGFSSAGGEAEVTLDKYRHHLCRKLAALLNRIARESNVFSERWIGLSWLASELTTRMTLLGDLSIPLAICFMDW